MTDRLANVILALSVIAGVASAAYYFRAPDSKPDGAAAAFELRPLYMPTLSNAARAKGQEIGFIRFRLPDGHRVQGLFVARLFPMLHGAPQVGHGVDVASAQTDGALDLEQWLSEAPDGERLLQVVLRVVGPTGAYAWNAWTKFEPSDLMHGSLVVTPLLQMGRTLRVETASAQPIPGALVAMEPEKLPPGMVATLLSTDSKGAIRVVGLEPKFSFMARLPEGVGPARRVIEQSFKGEGGEVVLRVPLTGRWTFVRSALRLPLAGVSVQIAALPCGKGRLPVAWPVARWVGPGRGPDTPLWIMRPFRAKTEPIPGALILRSKHRLDLVDVTKPFVAEMALKDGRFALSIGE